MNLSSKEIWKERIAYFFVNCGNIPIMTLVNSFLSIYYVETLNMDEIVVGTMFLVSRVFDGVNDPFIGFFIDRSPNSKFGKFRKILIIGSIICSINYLVLWIGPAYVPASAKIAVAYVSYMLLGVTFPVMDISLNSMLPVMTNDLNERNILSSVKTIGYGIGGFVLGFAAPILLSKFNSSKEAYVLLTFAAVIQVLACSIGGIAGVKQRINYENRNGYRLADLLRILTVKPVLMTFISGMFFFTGNAFVATSNTYYATFILGDVGKMTILNIAQAIGCVPAALIAPFAAKKIGKKAVYGAGIIVGGVGILLRLFAVNANTSGVIACAVSSAILAAGMGFSQLLFYSIQADNIDYVDYDIGLRSEGAVSAMTSMITKIGNGLGGAFPLYILAWTKTSSGAYSNYGLALADGVIPGILMIAGGLFFLFFYRLSTEKMEEVQDTLKQRRENVYVETE